MTARVATLAAPVAVAGLAAAGCAVIWWADPTTPGGPLPVCPIRALLGITCPGCGALRMVYSLLHGDLVAAAGFNALALAAVPVLLAGWGWWVLARWQGRPLPSLSQHRWAPAVIVAVVLVWSVIRNIPVEPFRALHL